MKASQKAKIIKGAEIGGAITAALLAASAGAYLLSEKKDRTRVKEWAKKARKEVALKAKKAERLGKAGYGAIVDQVLSRYGSLEDVSARDLAAAGRELKSHWSAIEKHAMKLARAKAASMKKAKASTAHTPTKKAAGKKKTSRRR